MRRNVDLLSVIVLALCAGITNLLFRDANILHVLFGVPLVLWLPGYALAAALFGDGSVQRVERVLISLGLSIAVAILSGFILNWTPLGLNAATWAFVLVGVTLGASALAWWRRSSVPQPQARPSASLQLSARDGVLFALAGVIALLALTVARVGAVQQPQLGFTQLWMVPVSDQSVQIGLTNIEAQPVTYRLVLRRGTRSLQEWPALALQPGQQWNVQVVLPSSDVSNLEVLLYRSDAPDQVYRRVAR